VCQPADQSAALTCKLPKYLFYVFPHIGKCRRRIRLTGIPISSLALFGVHEKTGKLYWDGKEIVTRSIFKLDTFERQLAVITLACVIGSFFINLANFVGEITEWW
jgi:hypothetical protein